MEVTEDSHEAGSLDMERNEGVSDTWMSVCNKKSKRDRKPPPSQAQTPKPLEVNTPQATSKPAKTSRRRKTPVIYQDDRAMVRQSWEEERVKVALRVPPKRRQHIIGPRGETIRRLCHQYPSLHVTVPSPQDTQCQEVTLDGLKSQVTAAARDITEHLEAIETRFRKEAARRQKDQVHKVVSLEVAPRHVVGIRAAPGRSGRSQLPEHQTADAVSPDARSSTPEPSRDLFLPHYSTTQSPVNRYVDAVTGTVDPVTTPPHLVSGPENFVTAAISLAEPITAPKHTTIAPADIVNTPQDPFADTTAQVEESVPAPVIAPLESVSTTVLPHDSSLGHSLTSEALKDSRAQEVTPSAMEVT